MSFKIGKVISFFEKMQIAAVMLDAPLALGEQVSFVMGGQEIASQTVDSLQIEHRKVESAGKGDIVSISVKEKIQNGADVFKI